MGYTQYQSIREVNLDYSKTCDHCKMEFAVVLRVYGSGEAIAGHGLLNALTQAETKAAGRADEQAVRSALEQANASANLYHRCTHCGFYGAESIQNLKRAYGGYRFLRNFLTYLANAGMILVAALIVFGVVRRIGGNPHPNLARFLVLGVVAVALGIVARVFAPMSKEEFLAKVNALNDPEIVQKWLAEWKAKSPGLLESLRKEDDLMQRNAVWEDVEKLQHKYDPVSVMSAQMSAQV